MAGLHFSRLTEADLLTIGLYTLRAWGEAQTDRYLRELEDGCRQLAGNPELGRTCDHVRRGLRRMEYGKHVVLYREQGDGILVCRVLHQSMLPERQDIDDIDL